MNVLILPHNMASMPSQTAEALNRIEGVNAKCVTIERHKYQSLGPHTIYMTFSVSKRKPLKWLWHLLTLLKKKKKLYRLIEWADVVHYHWDSIFPDNKDLKWAAKSGMPIFVEWVGSEIRIPDVCKKINPYYAKAFDSESGNEFHNSSRNRSLTTQKKFSDVGAIPLIIPEMNLYVQKEIFPITYPSEMRINLAQLKPVFPSVNNKRPLIIHSPSVKALKGTNFIIPVVEELKKDYDFEFVLLHDMSREEVLGIMQKADIFLDQIILGSYGMATMEAMSFGKPVMCYIMQEVFEAGLSTECPIVNTNPDNLQEVLRMLITNPQLRHDIGIKSRAFAEKFHDIDKVSSYLLKIYKTELEKRVSA